MRPSFLERRIPCEAGNVDVFGRSGSPTTSPHVSMVINGRSAQYLGIAIHVDPEEARVIARNLMDCANVADGLEVTL